jgi:hypothetical protein
MYVCKPAAISHAAGAARRKPAVVPAVTADTERHVYPAGSVPPEVTGLGDGDGLALAEGLGLWDGDGLPDADVFDGDG